MIDWFNRFDKINDSSNSISSKQLVDFINSVNLMDLNMWVEWMNLGNWLELINLGKTFYLVNYSIFWAHLNVFYMIGLLTVVSRFLSELI